jgi:hypothetical protein
MTEHETFIIAGQRYCWGEHNPNQDYYLTMVDDIGCGLSQFLAVGRVSFDKFLGVWQAICDCPSFHVVNGGFASAEIAKVELIKWYAEQMGGGRDDEVGVIPDAAG